MSERRHIWSIASRERRSLGLGKRRQEAVQSQRFDAVFLHGCGGYSKPIADGRPRFSQFPAAPDRGIRLSGPCDALHRLRPLFRVTNDLVAEISAEYKRICFDRADFPAPCRSAMTRKPKIPSDEAVYAAKLRDGIRTALRRKGVDPDDSAALGRAALATGSRNRRLFQQFLAGQVRSPRGFNMRRITEFLGVSEDELLAPEIEGYQIVGEGNRLTGPVTIRDLSTQPQDVVFVSAPEYDVRPSSTTREGRASMHISERPIIAYRQVSPGILSSKLHPLAIPAIIRISGDAMEPAYPAGSLVLIDTSFNIPSPPGVYVLFDGDTHYLMRCQPIVGSNRGWCACFRPMVRIRRRMCRHPS
jgi:hypothetical protein